MLFRSKESGARRPRCSTNPAALRARGPRAPRAACIAAALSAPGPAMRRRSKPRPPRAAAPTLAAEILAAISGGARGPERYRAADPLPQARRPRLVEALHGDWFSDQPVFIDQSVRAPSRNSGPPCPNLALVTAARTRAAPVSNSNQGPFVGTIGQPGRATSLIL